MNQKYPYTAYDKYLSLTISATLWFIIIYLMRPYAVILISLSNMKDHTGLIEMVYGSERSVMALGAIAAIPAILVVVAYIKRNPDASPFMRQLWHRSHHLLIASGLLNLVVTCLPFVLSKSHSANTATLIQLGLTLYILYELFTSKRIKDTFLDFPEPSKSD